MAKYRTLTADGAVKPKPCYFSGVIVTPDGTNNITISIYDNASAASGDKPTPTMTFSGTGGTQFLGPPRPVRMNNGIYVDITTAGTVEYTVYYD